MNIKDIDLNLLVALDRLIEFRSVSQAANELGITQPAMSNVLSRLRKTFDDELLVKVGRGMDLTSRAKEIAPSLKEVIHSIQANILDSKSFDPNIDEFHFKLAFHDYEQLVVHSEVLPYILKNNPRISIEHIPPRSIHPTEDLGSGVIDFATGPITMDRTGIIRRKLFRDDFVCLCDRRHKKFKKSTLTTELYSDLEHIFIAPHGGMTGQVDLILQKKKLKRFIRMSVTEFSVTPWVILNTELIVTLPRKAAKIFASQHKDLVIHDCPIKIDPIDIYLSWHERLNKSGPHLWLKELIVNSMY